MTATRHVFATTFSRANMALSYDPYVLKGNSMDIPRNHLMMGRTCVNCTRSMQKRGGENVFVDGVLRFHQSEDDTNCNIDDLCEASKSKHKR